MTVNDEMLGLDVGPFSPVVALLDANPYRHWNKLANTVAVRVHSRQGNLNAEG